MVFNATFNNISVISLRSVLLVAETGGPGEDHQKSEILLKVALNTIKQTNILIEKIFRRLWGTINVRENHR
jgi:hypothetical protein